MSNRHYILFIIEAETSSESDFYESGSEYIPSSNSSPIIGFISPLIDEEGIFSEKDDDVVCSSANENVNEGDIEEGTLNDISLPQETKKVEKKKKYKNKKSFCFYCETDVTNFSRHLFRNHQSEKEVQEILTLPKKKISEETCIFKI